MDGVSTEVPGFPAMPGRIDMLVLGGRYEKKRQTSQRLVQKC